MLSKFNSFLRDVGAFGFWTAVKVFVYRRRGHGFGGGDLKEGEAPIVVRAGVFGPVSIRFGDSDWYVVRQVLRDREYDFPGARCREVVEKGYEAILKKGKTPVIVDAGANIGISAVWFHSVFPQAMIVALEPDKANASVARANTSQIGNVRVVEAAIGSQSGFVSLSNSSDSDQSWAVTTERAVTGIPVMTIPDATDLVPNGEIFLVKVDIEGFEEDLFSANLDWIDQSVAIFVEPHDWLFPGRRTSRPLQKAFGSRDFDVYLSGENLLFVNGAVR